MAILEERTISGKGTLRLPPNDDLRNARIVSLYALVIRPPSNEYTNVKFNPVKSYYATLQFLRGGYVQFTATMEYFTQMWDFYVDPAFAPIYALQCSEAALRLGLADIGSDAPASSIAEWRHTNTLWDEIKVVCYADTAIALQVVSQPLDVCVPIDEDDPPDDPPEPPPPPDPVDPPVPVGQPLGEGNEFFPSPPYDEEDSDGGDTAPFPGDEYEPPPPPDPIPGTWFFRFRGSVAGSSTFEGTAPGFDNDEPGIATNANSACVGGTQYNIVATARGNARYSTTLSLSTCGSGAMTILVAEFTPD